MGLLLQVPRPSYSLRLAAYPAPWLAFDLDVGQNVTVGLRFQPLDWRMRPFVAPIAGIDLDSWHRARYGGRVGFEMVTFFHHVRACVFVEVFEQGGWHLRQGVAHMMVW